MLKSCGEAIYQYYRVVVASYLLLRVQIARGAIYQYYCVLVASYFSLCVQIARGGNISVLPLIGRWIFSTLCSNRAGRQYISTTAYSLVAISHFVFKSRGRAIYSTTTYWLLVISHFVFKSHGGAIYQYCRVLVSDY